MRVSPTKRGYDNERGWTIRLEEYTEKDSRLQFVTLVPGPRRSPRSLIVSKDGVRTGIRPTKIHVGRLGSVHVYPFVF